MITLYIACSRLSDSGEDTKERDTRKVGGAKKRKRKKPLLSPVSSHFIFVFTLSQFSRPYYLRARNRLHCTMKGKVDGLWNKIFMGIFRSTLHGFFLFLWPLWLNHTHSKTDDITRSRRELDQQGGGGGGGGTGGLGGNVEPPLNLIYCHQFFLLFLLKCAEEPWKGTLYSLIFFTSNIKHLHPALQSCKQNPV